MWLVALCMLPGIAAGCDDPVSPDEMRRMIEHVLDPAADWDSDYGDAFGPPPAMMSHFPYGEIMVEVDGEWARFRAFAVEYAHVPDTGHFGSLSRNRRMLYAWRIDDPAERFVLSGGGFPGALGPWGVEGEPDELFGYRPHIMMRAAGRRAWQNRRGTASFATGGRRRDDCNFPNDFSTAFNSVRDDGSVDSSSTGGFTCEEMLYVVAFEAELGRRWAPEHGRLAIRMLPQQVPGIRMTRECDGSEGAVAHLCGAFMFAPAPADSQKVEPPPIH